MAETTPPDPDLGRQSGHEPSQFRIAGREVAVYGAILDGEAAEFDNGVLSGKSRVEQGIQFGPEVLRAMGGRRVLALWLAASKDEAGKPGWFGLTVGEMRVDAAKREGMRDPVAFQTKLTDAARGRVSVFALKPPERKVLGGLLAKHPDLWTRAPRAFRESVAAAIPEAAAIGGGAAAAAPGAAGPAAPGTESGFPPTTLRSAGRDVTVAGCIVRDGKAEWDNGLLSGKSKAEQGVDFGSEVLRALGGKRVVGLWVSMAPRPDGKPGWFGAAVGEMRIDAAKKEGFRDVTAWGLKLNEAARGRVELWRLKPDERTAVAALLRERADLWEAAVSNVRDAFA
jgi:hypothetical protein